jgi:hypothetical protein
VGRKNQVGQGRIQWIADCSQFDELLFAIIRRQQRPGFIQTQPFELLRHGGLKVHHRTAGSEHGAIFRLEHGPSASGNEYLILRRELFQHAGFAFAEAAFPFDVKNQVDADPGALFDLAVTVKKCQSQFMCQPLPNGGFSRTHGADQVDIAFFHRQDPASVGTCMWL